MSTRRKLLIVTATAAVLVAGVVGTALGTRSSNTPRPLESATRGTAQPNVGPAGLAPRRGTAHIARTMRRLAPRYAIFRRVKTARYAKAVTRRVTASDGTVVTVELNDIGLCVSGFGTTACGDPAEATTHPVIAHAASPKEEILAGPVPDEVATVQVIGTQGNASVSALTNVFVARIRGHTAGLRWVMKDGSIRQQLP